MSDNQIHKVSCIHVLYTILRFHINDSRHTTGVFLEARSSFKCKLQYLTSEMNPLFLLYELFLEATSRPNAPRIHCPVSEFTAQYPLQTYYTIPSRSRSEYCMKCPAKIRPGVLHILQKLSRRCGHTSNRISQERSRPSVYLMVTHI